MIMGRKMLAVLLLAAGVISAQGQSSTDSAIAKQPHAPHKSVEQMLEDLNAKYDRLEQEMQQLKQQMAQHDATISATKTAAATAQSTATQAAQQVQTVQQGAATSDQTLSSVSSDVDTLKSTTDAIVNTMLNVQQSTGELATPLAIHYRGVDLFPGGFLAGETVDRTRGMGADVNTPFSSTPFAGSTAGMLSEFNASGRQSRISLMAEGRLDHTTLRGYYEADFLSAGTTSNNNQSNSYTLRQRQVWAQADINNRWIFTAGQMWSLATEYRSGLTNTKEATPLTIDAQYHVGFTWERQYGFRVVHNFDDRIWAGISVEAAQTLNIGGHNLPTVVDQQGCSSGGLYNSTANCSYNFGPDLIAKLVYEPHFGGHFELFAVGRFFRGRVYPNDSYNSAQNNTSLPPTYGAFTSKAEGGGLGINARMPVLNKRLDIGAHVLAGSGIGRYSTTTLSDMTLHADGSLEPLSAGSALGSLEFHATPRLDIYGYYGGEYVKRAYYWNGLYDQSGTAATNPTYGLPILVGYGAPTNVVTGCNVEATPSGSGSVSLPGTATNCNADTRNIQEGTVGYWFRFYKGSKGTLQQGFQYSYLVRHTWLGIGDPLNSVSGSPKAVNNMWFTSFRYYLP